MEIFARLIELKPSTSEQVQDWAKFINEHRLTALETLRAEGVMIESWFSLSPRQRLPPLLHASGFHVEG